MEKGRNGNGFGLNLAQWAALLPTPTASDGGAWKPRHGTGMNLRAALLPTHRASEWKGTGPLGSKSHLHRVSRGYLDATMQELSGTTGRLAPPFVEWMMGFPQGWTDTDCAPSATPSSRKSSRSSVKQL